MRLTVLKTGRASDALCAERGEYAQWFADALGWPLHRLDVIDATAFDAFPHPSQLTGLLVTGSPHSVHDRPEWSVRAGEWLKIVAEANVPTLGVCYGHQLLGDALGADVGLNPAGREIGTVDIEILTDDPLFEGLPRQFPALITHSDTVNTLPIGTTNIARTAMTPLGALRYGPRCRTIQWHPEFDAHILRTIVRERAKAIDGETGPGSAQRVLDGLVGVHTGPPLLRNFVRHFVEGEGGPG
jgi:GMP synthase (glutamine-hydrolysing)